MLTSRLSEGQLGLDLHEKPMSHDGTQGKRPHPSSTFMLLLDGEGIERMAGCRCWQRSQPFVPAVEDSTLMS